MQKGINNRPKRTAFLSVFLALATTVLPARADYYDAGELLKMFNAIDEVGPLFARAYVAGVQDFGNGIHFCVSENVKLSQAAAIVEKFLANNPERWHKPGKQIVMEALAAAFPCSKRK